MIKPNIDYKKAVNTFKAFSYKKNGLVQSKKYLDKLCSDSPVHAIQYKKAFFTVYKDIHTFEAVKIGEDIIKYEPNYDFIKTLASKYRKIGNISRAETLIINIENKEYFVDKVTKSKVISFLKDRKDYEIKQKIYELISKYPNDIDRIYKMTFSILNYKYPSIAIKYGMMYFVSNRYDFKFNNSLEQRLVEMGMENNLKILNENKEYFNKIKKLEQGSFFRAKEYNKHIFLKQLKVISNNFSQFYIEDYIGRTIELFIGARYDIYKDSFSVLKDKHTKLSFVYADSYCKYCVNDSKFKRTVDNRKKLFEQKKKDDLFIKKFIKSDIFLNENLDIDKFNEKFNKLVKYSSEYIIENCFIGVMDLFEKQQNDIRTNAIGMIKQKYPALAQSLENKIA